MLQGLGGLGKTTLALHMLRQLLHAGDDLCTLWCQDAEKAETPEGIAEALVGQLLEYCRKRFGPDWESVVQEVDRTAGDDPARRFAAFLGTLLANVPRLVLYLDNLESLLVGPAEVGAGRPDPDAFGAWRTPALAAIWSVLTRFAEGERPAARRRELPLSQRRVPPAGPDPGLAPAGRRPVPPDGLVPRPAAALHRDAGPAGRPPRRPPPGGRVRQRPGRARPGHWEERRGPWRLPDPPTAADLEREWDELVGPALPAGPGAALGRPPAAAPSGTASSTTAPAACSTA